MQAISTFLILIFHLSVGPAESKAFKSLQGDWIVQQAFVEGKELPGQDWKGKVVSFRSEEVDPISPQSVLLGGRLRVKGNMSWIETKSLGRCDDKGHLDDPDSVEYSSSYEISGNEMKLLLTKVTAPNHRGPRPLAESKGEGGILLLLKRKK